MSIVAEEDFGSRREATKLLRLAVVGLLVLSLSTQLGAESPQITLAAPASVIPLGLDSPLPVPDHNPSTPEKIALGRKLFFDPILSRSNSVSCSSCHLPDRGFSHDAPLPSGIEGKKGRRNAPTLLNRAYAKNLFWDGRAATLESQALQPIENPLEMGSGLENVVKRLRADAAYETAFKSAFEDGISAQNISRALAAFERTLLTGNSPVDQFRNSKFSALNDSARQGLWLFESRGLCWKCHSGRNFTDEEFHNTGVGWGKTPADWGRFEVTAREEDRGRFKTPTLRDVAKTAPYMHDGSLRTLREVVEFYNRGGTANPNLDPVMKPLSLSEAEMQNLIDFLEALTGHTASAPESR